MKQEYAISIYLDTRREKASGKYPVKLRVFTSTPRKQKLYPTKFEFTKKEFQSIWQTIGAHIGHYKNYPRIVGETGGKDFVVLHSSANPDDAYEATLELCDQTSVYGLTGAVFARERRAVATARRILVNAAGNFYINDKPSGAVVGQQPFGGARASGTNDKAGSMLNLYRWLSPRTIKENFNPPVNYRYPLMEQA